MSIVDDTISIIDQDVTNKTALHSISPQNVGESMKAVLSATLNPVNSIIMYHPSDLSEFDVSGLGVADNVLGWAICNGSNGTPDLRGRFIVGYNPSDSDYNTIGKTGGAKTVTLTLDQIPSHTHGMGSERVEINPEEVTVGDAWNNGADGNYPNGTGTGPAGGGQAHENRPPYYTLVYIKRIL